MDCDTCRELISARLDGELTDEPADLEGHLVGCADCRSFEARLVTFTRTNRIRAAEPVPDQSAAILARVGAGRARPLHSWVRYGLVVVALTQLVLALPELLPTRDSAVVHLEHHLGAWDVAMAIGLLVVAWQPERARGLLPTGLALGGILLLTGLIDVLSGSTVPLSEAPHALELVGIALLWFLARTARRRPPMGLGHLMRMTLPARTR